METLLQMGAKELSRLEVMQRLSGKRMGKWRKSNGKYQQPYLGIDPPIWFPKCCTSKTFFVSHLSDAFSLLVSPLS